MKYYTLQIHIQGSKLTLLHATEAHLDMIRSRDEEAKVLRQNAEPLGLKEFHYATMGAVRAVFKQ